MHTSTSTVAVCCQGKGKFDARLIKNMKYEIVKPRALFMYLCVSEPVCAELRMCS